MCSVECAWPGVCLNYTLSVESARKSSPCGVNWFGKREKVRPAWEKWLAFGVFGRAGRVFSRFGQGEAVAGRTFSRGNGWRGVLGEFFAVWPGLGCCWASFFARERLEGRAGRVFSRFGQDWAVVGRTFSRGDAEVAGCSNVIACWRHPVKRRHWPSRENTTRPRAARRQPSAISR